MPKVDARLEKGFHSEVFPNRGCCRRGGNGLRFWYWGRFGSDSCGWRGLRFLGNFRCRLFREV
tara:strand:+ start:209 stop:397 length:189 start_codon:yes stop_codon:yes gene_type:complete